MALITRLSRLFQADFHAVLDRIEKPELQLKQAVREMQFALDHDRQGLKSLQDDSVQLDKVKASTTIAIKGFDKELDICIAAKKDDLARDVIRRKLMAAKQLQAIEDQVESITRSIQALSHQVDEQLQQLDSMKQKLELLVNEEQPYNSAKFHQMDCIRHEEIEIALLKEKQLRG